MALSNSIASYDDVRAVLDALLEQGGGRYRLRTPGQAVRWRQRAYKLRALLLKLDEEAKIVPGIAPSTPYDQIVLTVSENEVIVTVREPEGELFDRAGNRVELKEFDPGFQILEDGNG